MKYKRTQEIRNEKRTTVGVEKRGGGWAVKVNTVRELMKDGISNWTMLVNWGVSGVNSTHNPFRSLAHNCIDLSSVNRLI